MTELENYSSISIVGWGGECVTPVLVRSLKLSKLVHS